LADSKDYGDPTSSPDGTKIAYASGRTFPEDRDIYVMARSGKGKIALTDNNHPEYGPAWSPDSSEIAFMRQEWVATPDGGFDWQVDVWVMNADGLGRPKNVSNDPSYDESPDWGPKPTTAP
jgi:Tol biopolymer transport system component